MVNYKGIIHLDYLPPRKTTNAGKYCTEIDAVQAKLLETEPVLVNRKGVILFHDNAKTTYSKKRLRKKLPN